MTHEWWTKGGSLARTTRFDNSSARKFARFVSYFSEAERIRFVALTPPCPGASARLLPEREIADRHRPINRLAHVVDGECRDTRRGHRFHLDTGAVNRVDIGLYLDICVFEAEVDEHRADEQRVAQRQQ